jgi:hypothetical protein
MSLVCAGCVCVRACAPHFNYPVVWFDCGGCARSLDGFSCPQVNVDTEIILKSEAPAYPSKIVNRPLEQTTKKERRKEERHKNYS